MSNLPYSDIDKRNFQVWNSDAKQYLMNSEIDLSSYVNDTFVKVADGFFLNMRQQLDGTYRVLGRLEFIGPLLPSTTDGIIDLSTILAGKELITNLRFNPQNSLTSGGEDMQAEFYLYLGTDKIILLTTYSAGNVTTGAFIDLDLPIYPK